MTTITEALTGTRDLQVRTDQTGKPLAIRHDGQIWLVDPGTDSQHWFSRGSWCDTKPTAAIGDGDLVSFEHWRIKVRLGSSDSALRTITLRRDPVRARWLLDTISDGG
ncbi:hypothetical protein [Arthrobacter oryzae]|uniref:Uncharacterized protein n=1 Tax=Arthrobacter oryzae TaxID=409290 RepID=A0A3N0C2L4_9MICC|nr:hypothetical protein [Arthrobacter oryzae]RNL55992.1 hypothetical protein D7003_09215 [Arthrobacter oryzae]